MRSVLEKDSCLILNELIFVKDKDKLIKTDNTKKYRIIRYMGKGTSSIVYLAEDVLHSGNEVILKEMYPSSLSETMIRNNIDGINIVSKGKTNDEVWEKEKIKFCLSVDNQIYAQKSSEAGSNLVSLWTDKSGDGVYSAVSFDGGAVFKDVVDDMPIEHILSICADVAFYLSEFHRKNLIHMDIKSENILISKINPHVRRILDFNSMLPFYIENGDTSDPFSPYPKLDIDIIRNKYDNMISYTKACASPELFLGENPAECNCIGPASDIYSLGIMLWNSLTGENTNNAFQILLRSDFYEPAFELLKPHLKQELSPDSHRWKSLCNIIYEMIIEPVCTDICPENLCTECEIAKLRGNNVKRCRNTSRISAALRALSMQFRRDSFEKNLDQTVAAVKKSSKNIGQINSPDEEMLTVYRSEDGSQMQLYDFIRSCNFPQTVLCLGESGAGKSVSAKYCVQKLEKDSYKNKIVLPVYVSLGEVYDNGFRSDRNTLLYKLHNMFWGGDDTDITRFMDKINNDRNDISMILFWDGFNEIKSTEGRKKAISDFDEIKKYPFIKIIASCQAEIPEIGFDMTMRAENIDSAIVREKIIRKGYTEKQAEKIIPVLRTPMLLNHFLRLSPDYEKNITEITEASILERYFDEVIVSNIIQGVTKDKKIPEKIMAEKILDDVIAPLVFNMEHERSIFLSRNVLDKKLRECNIPVTADELISYIGIFEQIGSYNLKLVHQSYQDFLWAYDIKNWLSDSRNRSRDSYRILSEIIEYHVPSEKALNYLNVLVKDIKAQYGFQSIMKKRVLPAGRKLSSFYKSAYNKKQLPFSVRQLSSAMSLCVSVIAAALYLCVLSIPDIDTLSMIMPDDNGHMSVVVYGDKKYIPGLKINPDFIINGNPDINIYSVKRSEFTDKNNNDKIFYQIETDDMHGRPFNMDLRYMGGLKTSMINVENNYSSFYYNVQLESLEELCKYRLHIKTSDNYKIEKSGDIADYLVPVNAYTTMVIELENDDPHHLTYLIHTSNNAFKNEFSDVYGYPDRFMIKESFLKNGHSIVPLKRTEIKLNDLNTENNLCFLLKKGAFTFTSENDEIIKSSDEMLVFSNIKVMEEKQ